MLIIVPARVTVTLPRHQIVIWFPTVEYFVRTVTCKTAVYGAVVLRLEFRQQKRPRRFFLRFLFAQDLSLPGAARSLNFSLRLRMIRRRTTNFGVVFLTQPINFSLELSPPVALQNTWISKYSIDQFQFRCNSLRLFCGKRTQHEKSAEYVQNQKNVLILRAVFALANHCQPLLRSQPNQLHCDDVRLCCAQVLMEPYF